MSGLIIAKVSGVLIYVKSLFSCLRPSISLMLMDGKFMLWSDTSMTLNELPMKLPMAIANNAARSSAEREV